MKRQRGRGRKPGNNNNRSFESNGPDVKIRGNAQTVYDKYLQLARDATSSGDRIMAENYYQHAEHYFRVIQANQQRREEYLQNQQNNQQNSDQNRSRSNEDGDSDNRGRGRGRSRNQEDVQADQSKQEQPNLDATEDKPKRGRKPRVKAEETNTSDPLAVVDPSSDDQDKKPRRRRTTKASADNAAQNALDKADSDSDTKNADTAAA